MIKIKKLTKDQIKISIDRLTRFKEPESRYLRVFKEIIQSNLLEPKYKKNELETLDYDSIKSLAEYIINNSLPNLISNNYSINEKIYNYENTIFNISNEANKLIRNKINYKSIIELIKNDNLPENLEWLISLDTTNTKLNNCTYPIKKILLCEGITEEILLPKFAQICGCNLKNNGIYIVSAGGKNQVVKYFYNYSDILKIPVFILLDSDAKENIAEIKPKLRVQDKIHLLKSGEFEDLLPNSLIEKALNSATLNISMNSNININEYNSKVEFLEEYFKHRGLHEFKKAEFAEIVKECILNKEDISDEINEIISELANNKKEAEAPL